MKQKRLAPILAVTLSLELIVSPVIAHAQSGNSAAQKINNTADTIASGIKAIGAVWNAAQGGMQGAGLPPQTTADIQKLREQQTPQPDKYFNPQKLMQIPGLSEYLAINRINPAMLDCRTLPTTIHDAQPEACRLGAQADTGLPVPVQMAQMDAYYKEYFQVSKMYQNFSADSNSDGQAFGIGCMNNAMNILNGFFKYRVDELDKLTTNLEAMQNQFREASRADLDAIEEAVAVLEGDSELADKVRSKKPELFDFGKRFKNPACSSMFAGEALNDMGRKDGLNAINRNVKDLLTSKNGKYSGESYSQSHAAVVEDISAVADKVAKQVELNFSTQGSDPKAYGDFLKSVPGLVSSSSGVQDSIRLDMFADVQGKFTEQFAKLSEEKALIQSEIPASARALDKLGSLDSATFEAEVNTLENGIKNSCLSSSLGNTDKLLSKIYDPTASSHANKYASNFLKDKLEQILNNQSTSIEKKLADLKALEANQGNRYYMKMENSYEVQDVDANGKITSKVVGANVRRSPSVYFSDIIKNCNAQFKANKLNNKLTGAAAIQRLRNLSQNFKNFAKTQAADVKKEIRKKLIECTGPEVANNTVPGSCTPELFNTRAPGFCANAAFSCSKNMQACSKQAEGYVKEIKDQKTARVNNYKALVQKNKQDIVKMFDAALSRYMRDGEMLRGMFGAGFSSPAGIKREVMPERDRYISDFADATGKQGSPDGKLLLEDPEKYVEMFKGNIELLKASVKKQQDQILGGDSVNSGKDGLLAAHIKKTEKNYKDVIRAADKTSQQCRGAYDAIVQQNDQQRKKQQEEQMKMNKELGEKLPRFCKKYGTASNNPGPACSGNVDDLVTSAIQAANRSGNRADMDAVMEFRDVCDMNGGDESPKTGSENLSPQRMCDELKKLSDSDKTIPYNEICLAVEKGKKSPEWEKASSWCPKVQVTVAGDQASSKAESDCGPYFAKEIAKDFDSRFKGNSRVTGAVTVTTALPSFCMAGDNTNRGGQGKDNMTNALEEIARQLATKQ